MTQKNQCHWCRAIIPDGFDSTIACPVHAVNAMRLAEATVAWFQAMPMPKFSVTR